MTMYAFRIEMVPDPSAEEAFERCDEDGRRDYADTRAAADLRRQLREMCEEREREQLLECCRRLPMTEQTVLQLTLDGVTQREIACRLGIAQPSVCERVKRAIERMRFMLDGCPKVYYEDDLERELARINALGEEHVNALVAFARCHGVEQSARLLRIPTRTFRDRLSAGIRILAKHAPEWAARFQEARQSPKLLREVSRPWIPTAETLVKATAAATEKAYDGPNELRPVKPADVEYMRAAAKRGVSLDTIATACELDAAYVRFLVMGEWK